MDVVVFYAFAAIAVLAAIGMVTFRNPVHSALSLALVFISLAAMYVLLSAPFIAVAQVLIYAGAILILFVFVIMLLSPGVDQGGGVLRTQRWLAPVIGAVLLVELLAVLAGATLAPGRGAFTPEAIAAQGDVEAVGTLLFTNFLLPFEITSLLLLMAIVGVIVLSKRKRAR